MTSAPPVGRPIYEGGDTRRIQEAVGSRLVPHRFALRPGSTVRARFQLLRSGAISVFRLSYGTDIEMVVEAGAPVYLAFLNHTGDGRLTIAGRRVPLSPALLGPGHRFVAHWGPDTSAVIARIPKRLVDDAVRQLTGEPPSVPVRFEPTLDVGDLRVRQWLTLAGGLGPLTETGLFAESPPAARHFEQALVHGLLASQPNSLAQRARSVPTRGTPPSLQPALEYCDEHAAEHVAVADIAAAAGMSVRTLQEKFRAHLGVTPLTHLRHVRLEKAHADLVAVAEGRAEASVTDIALRWGFTHLGRFGSMYRQRFGCLPSRTVRRVPGAYNRTAG